MAASPTRPGEPSTEVDQGRQRFTWLLTSEWTKFRSVRSTFWTLLVTVIATIGIGALISFAVESNHSHATAVERFMFDPTSTSLSGIGFAQLALGVLGVLVISSEYGTGMVRATFAATPRRHLVLAAKAIVFGSVALAIGLVCSFVAFFVGQRILALQAIQTTISAPDVLRAVFGGGLYLTVMGLLALGIGALIRHTAGALAAFVGLILVLPAVAFALPSSWAHVVDKILPTDLGTGIGQVVPRAHFFGPWAGFGLFCAWAAAALVAAALVTAHRDA
ncbi:MAG: ABC transporter permease [Acidimicrobiales bacterium]